MSRYAFALLSFVACAPSGARFTPEGPLELLANIDDDDGDRVRDGLDERLNGAVDIEDFATVTLQTGCRGSFLLAVEPRAAAEHVHLFLGEALTLGGKTAQATLPCGTHTLRIEALRTRSQLWDGRVALTAATARLELRVAPVLFSEVTQPPTRVYAVDFVAGLPLSVGERGRLEVPEVAANQALIAALRGTQVPLVLAAGATHFFERWMQDAVSAGMQRVKGGGSLEVLLQMDRPTGTQGLEGFAATQLGPGVGLALPGRDDTTVLSYGGNLEVIPPTHDFPLGRLVIGGDGARHMGPSTRAWLDAQQAQGPVLELPTAWLETAHIDELVAFVPNARDGGWQGFVASPRLAWATLEALDGGTPSVRTRGGTRPVTALLADVALHEFNLRAAEQLDVLAATFQRETGRTLIELPQLFEANDAGLGVALHPSLVNLVSVGEVALMLSSDLDGGVFEPVAQARLGAVGVRAVFVEASQAYHAHGGGLHCGVEVQRRR